MKKTVKTRFAPSPTGALHIGGARTALFNYLYAQHCGGEYYVRIEDTDQSRSTEENKILIKDGLEWLGLNPASPWVLQSENIDKHKSAIKKLLAEGKAYYCACSQEEFREQRDLYEEKDIINNKATCYRCMCSNMSLDKNNGNVARIRIPTEGTTAWDDAVQGHIEIQNSTLDDFIIARSDGTPTYNFVVAMDDAEMDITHVIRGDDHINNTPKQIHVYQALGLDVPTFAHVPLIHGKNGKMSKRDGATSVIEYRDMGYLPEAVNNYLMKLGWSLGDEEVISSELAIEKFDICDVNKGASIFDMEKLDWLNGQYLKETANSRLVELLEPFFAKLGFSYSDDNDNDNSYSNKNKLTCLEKGLTELKEKSKRLDQLAESAKFYLANYDDIKTQISVDEKSSTLLANPETQDILAKLAITLKELPESGWNKDTLMETLKAFCETQEVKFKAIGMPLRPLLTGSTKAPSVGSLLESFGKEESLVRLNSYK